MTPDTIKYSIHTNPLAGDYRAVMNPDRSVNTEGLIQQMINRGTTVTEADIRAVITELLRAIELNLVNGRSVNIDGIVRLWAGIRGRFDSVNDSYDASRHQLVIHSRSGRQLSKSIRKDGVLEKIGANKTRPELNELRDLYTGSVDNTLTPGRNAVLTGALLKVNEAEPDEGAFLINQVDHSETRVTEYVRNKPGELAFFVPPELPDATAFKLEVRTRYLGSEKLRASVHEAVLTTRALAAA